jgi:hypothetical protein
MGNPVAAERAVWAYSGAELVVIVAGLAAEFDDEEDPTVVARAGVVACASGMSTPGPWISRRRWRGRQNDRRQRDQRRVAVLCVSPSLFWPPAIAATGCGIYTCPLW